VLLGASNCGHYILLASCCFNFFVFRPLYLVLLGVSAAAVSLNILQPFSLSLFSSSLPTPTAADASDKNNTIAAVEKQ
jgi:hypothetical protein